MEMVTPYNGGVLYHKGLTAFAPQLKSELLVETENLAGEINVSATPESLSRSKSEAEHRVLKEEYRDLRRNSQTAVRRSKWDSYKQPCLDANTKLLSTVLQ